MSGVTSALIDRSVEDPASAVARADLWEILLRELTATQRTAVVLRCRHSMTFDEVGLALGLTKAGARHVFIQTIALLRASGKAAILLVSN